VYDVDVTRCREIQ